MKQQGLWKAHKQKVLYQRELGPLNSNSISIRFHSNSTTDDGMMNDNCSTNNNESEEESSSDDDTVIVLLDQQEPDQPPSSKRFRVGVPLVVTFASLSQPCDSFDISQPPMPHSMMQVEQDTTATATNANANASSGTIVSYRPVYHYKKRNQTANRRVSQSERTVPRKSAFTRQTWWTVDWSFLISCSSYSETNQQSGGAAALVARCMHSYSWSVEYARRVLREYRNFWWLLAHNHTRDIHYVQRPVPCQPVEFMWNEHVFGDNYEHDAMLLLQDSGPEPNQQVPRPEWGGSQHKQRRHETRDALRAHFGSALDTGLWWPELKLELQETSSATTTETETEGVEGQQGSQDNQAAAPVVFVQFFDPFLEHEQDEQVLWNTSGDESNFGIELDSPLQTVFDKYTKSRFADSLVKHVRFVHRDFGYYELESQDTPESLGWVEGSTVELQALLRLDGIENEEANNDSIKTLLWSGQEQEVDVDIVKEEESDLSMNDSSDECLF